MYCSKCGKSIDKDSQFCKNCGTPINADNNVQEINIVKSASADKDEYQDKSMKKKDLKIITIIGLVILGLIVIPSIFKGLTNFFTNDLHNSSVNKIEEQLKDKYGKSFSEYGANGTYLYMYPNDDPTLIFMVRADNNGEIVSEQYSDRYLQRQAEVEVQKIFSNYGIKTICNANFSHKITGLQNINNLKDISLDSIGFSCIVDNNFSDESTIETIYHQIYQKFNNINIGSIIYILDHSVYETAYDKVLYSDGSFESRGNYIQAKNHFNILYKNTGFEIRENGATTTG